MEWLMLHKILPAAVMPLGVCLWMCALGARLRKRWMVGVGLGVLWVGAMPATGDLLLGGLERRWPAVRAAEIGQCDVVYVLGGYMHRKTGPDGEPQWNEAADRMMMGLRLVESGQAETLAVEQGAGWAEGVLGAGKVVRLRRMKNTAEEMAELRRLMAEKGWKRVALVTSAFHMTRAMMLAEQEGIRPVPVPTDYEAGVEERRVDDFVPKGEGLEKTERALREWIGMGYYGLRGLGDSRAGGGARVEEETAWRRERRGGNGWNRRQTIAVQCHTSGWIQMI